MVQGLWEEQAKWWLIKQDGRLGREWIHREIKGKRNEAQVLGLVAKRRGQPGTHRRD